MMHYDSAREMMVVEQLVSRGITDPGVLKAMRMVSRHRFVEQGDEEVAYTDQPLPIGQHQTISQPYIVALMSEALELNADDKVLEIGTGSGYQTAVLAEMARQVYTVEKIKPLMDRAISVLKELGYDNVVGKLHDGTLGWPDHAPYDAILVTAGAPSVPQPLIDQLADGGRMVIPVGETILQELLKVTRHGDQVREQKLGGCRFVPLLGEYGW